MRIDWSERAVTRFDKAVSYGRVAFGIKAAQRFYQRIKHCEALLALNPQMGKVEPLLVGRKYEYRSLVVHEHFKMIYRVDDARDIIYIIDFWDVRQEPQTLTDGVSDTKR